MVHGGKLAAKALKDAGVGAIFTLSGGHIMPIYDGALDEGIAIIDVRHEQAAVHAADAYSRLNPGKIGCAALTAGFCSLCFGSTVFSTGASAFFAFGALD